MFLQAPDFHTEYTKYRKSQSRKGMSQYPATPQKSQ